MTSAPEPAAPATTWTITLRHLAEDDALPLYATLRDEVAYLDGVVVALVAEGLG